MPRSQARDDLAPEGRHFLDLVWEQEDSCEVATDALLPRLGKKGPACLEQIGTVLSLLDRMASCWWQCREGDHLVEYLCGRVASNARAALRLMRFGFYDEALSLCRAMGETANLLHLFTVDETVLGDWKACSRKERMKRYGPARVRHRLVNAHGPVITEERYRELSELASHVQPATRPRAYNILRVPSSGATAQEEGILACLNETALPLAIASIVGAYLLDLDRNTRERVTSHARMLVEQIGGATVVDIDDNRRHVLEDPAVRGSLAEIAQQLRSLQSDRRP